MGKLTILKNYLNYKNKKFKNRDALEAYQKKHIKKQLDYVASKSPFYKGYTGKPLSDYPIMDKKIMMENFNELNTVGIDKEEALAFAIDAEKTRSFSPTLKNITVGLSSGTSDTRGVFLVADKEKDIWAGYILSKVLYGSILDNVKIAFFMRANSNLYESVKSKNIQFEFFDIYKPINENLEKLVAFEPDILVGQPSVLLDVCEYVEQARTDSTEDVRDFQDKVKPKKVISIAEVLEDADKERIKKVLKVDVIHQVYQCTEGCLATTCEYGTIHLNEDIVHIEKEHIDDERFIPIITDFTRRSQPIIRYRLNDILVEQKEACPCGSCFTALRKIEGREDDVFVFDGEDKERVLVYPDFIRRCILFAGDVTDFRVVQQEDGNITIFIKDMTQKEAILAEFRKLATDREFSLPEIDFLEYTFDKKKKLKRVESNRR